MSIFETRAHVGSDRKLVVTVPSGFENSDVRVIVESPNGATGPKLTREELASALDRMAGSIDDPSYRRHEQGDFEQRTPLE